MQEKVKDLEFKKDQDFLEMEELKAATKEANEMKVPVLNKPMQF